MAVLLMSGSVCLVQVKDGPQSEGVVQNVPLDWEIDVNITLLLLDESLKQDVSARVES